MDSIRTYGKRYIYHIFLFFITVALFITNFDRGTSLTGWDNLQTDLYPWLAVKRAFFSVWQEYQSFGLVSGLAHATDIFRAILMWLFSFFLPQNVQRYFFNHLMLFVGAAGMYQFLSYVGFAEKRRVFAFVGAVFYMLNFGTIQIFSLPLEPFSAFFAFLPWQIWIFLEMVNVRKRVHDPKHVKMSRRKELVLFFVINLLGSTAFYIQTDFIVYMLLLAVLSFGLLFSRGFFGVAWRAPVLALFIILINIFWLGPQLYFLHTSGNVVREAKINTLSTGDLFYQNQEKGTLQNVAKFEGFYFDLFSPRGYIFASWKDHFNQPFVQAIQWMVIGIIIIGILSVTRLHPAFIFALLLTAIALMPSTYPFSAINELIRNNNTLNQIFRVPFTKFIIPYALVTSFFFTSGLATISWLVMVAHRFAKKHAPKKAHHVAINFHGRSPIEVYEEMLFHTKTHHHQEFTPLQYTEDFVQHVLQMGNKPPEKKERNFELLIPRFVCYVAFLFIILYALPAFRGYFYSPEVRVKIPEDYQKAFSFFKSVDKEKRIALLPDYTFWGWFFNRWGYDGSGFVWYGIEQPIVSRTFDVWSDKSESYFWEIKAAIEAEDPVRFQQVLQKYNIDYLFMDYTLIPVSASIKGLQYDRLEQLLSRSPAIKKVQKFDNIAIYEVKQNHTISDFVSIGYRLPNIGPNIKLTNEDTAYMRHQDYVTSNKQKFDYYFPYLDLMSQTRLVNKDWHILQSGNQFIFETELDQELMQNLGDYDIDSATDSAEITVFAQEKAQTLYSPIDIEFVGDKLHTSLDKRSIASYLPNQAISQPCGKPQGKTSQKITKDGMDMFASGGATNCVQFESPALEQKYGYLVNVQSENKEGRPLFFYILDRTKVQSFLEDRLTMTNSYYIVSPKFTDGVGYNFTFQNTSYATQTARNLLQKLEIYYLPFQDIKNIQFVTKTPALEEPRFDTQFLTEKVNYYIYLVDASRTVTPNVATVILYQQFHPGWKAYSINMKDSKGLDRFLKTYLPFNYGKEITDHVTVNNWANGWNLKGVDTSNTIVLIFWPQYLQFGGYALLLVMILWCGFYVYLHRHKK